LNFSDAPISGIFLFFFLAVNAKPNQLDYATDLYLTPLSPFYWSLQQAFDSYGWTNVQIIRWHI
jgi:hypothetical protein